MDHKKLLYCFAHLWLGFAIYDGKIIIIMMHWIKYLNIRELVKERNIAIPIHWIVYIAIVFLNYFIDILLDIDYF